ncbi:MAG: YHYH protein, partial [Chloroflexota bacterium]
ACGSPNAPVAVTESEVQAVPTLQPTALAVATEAESQAEPTPADDSTDSNSESAAVEEIAGSNDDSASVEENAALNEASNDVEESGASAEDATAADQSANTNEPSSNPLASQYLGSFTISDTGFGTEVNVTVDEGANTRTIESNALPNHQTGEFPNAGNPNSISAQDRTWTFPAEPTFVGEAAFAMTPGVAINGVKFEPDTAERATCESGEVHSIEAIQDVTDLGLDLNNAHVQPTGEYHYHGASTLLVDAFNSDQDLVHIGFAADGYMMYYSKSGAYQGSYRIGSDAREGTNCSYTSGGRNGTTIGFGSVKDGSLKSDWTYDPSYGDLDACNGTTVDGQYIYLITTDYPYVPRCLMGEFTSTGRGGGGGAPPSGGGQGGEQQAAGQGQGGQPPAGGQGGQGGPPDFDAAAEILGVSADALREALGPPPGDLEGAAAALGVSVEALQEALGLQPPQQ